MENDEISRFKKMTNHFKRHRTIYITAGVCFVGGAVLVGFTMPIMKKLFISPELLGTASPELLGTGERTVSSFNSNVKIIGNQNHINLQQIISANRQGAPSWVVRCLETGEVYPSQRAAAIANGLAESDLSRHLNGIRELSEGLHFERICMAA